MVGKTSYEKGIEKGLEKGIEKGRDEGQADLLERMLQRRFGPLTAAVRERLIELNPEQREQLAESIFTAASLADLGLDGPIA